MQAEAPGLWVVMGGGVWAPEGPEYRTRGRNAPWNDDLIHFQFSLLVVLPILSTTVSSLNCVWGRRVRLLSVKV